MKKFLFHFSLVLSILLSGCDIFSPKEPMILGSWSQTKQEEFVSRVQLLLQAALKDTVVTGVLLEINEKQVAKINLQPDSLSIAQVDAALAKIEALYRPESSSMTLTFAEETKKNNRGLSIIDMAKQENRPAPGAYKAQIDWSAIETHVYTKPPKFPGAPSKAYCAVQLQLDRTMPDVRVNAAIREITEADLPPEMKALSPVEQKKLLVARNSIVQATNMTLATMDLIYNHERIFEDKELNLIPLNAFSTDGRGNTIITIGELEGEVLSPRFDFGGEFRQKCRDMVMGNSPFLAKKLANAGTLKSLRALHNIRRNPNWKPNT